jgi:hypothetical protein
MNLLLPIYAARNRMTEVLRKQFTCDAGSGRRIKVMIRRTNWNS